MIHALVAATSAFVLINAWFTFKRWRRVRLRLVGKLLKDAR